MSLKTLGSLQRGLFSWTKCEDVDDFPEAFFPRDFSVKPVVGASAVKDPPPKRRAHFAMPKSVVGPMALGQPKRCKTEQTSPNMILKKVLVATVVGTVQCEMP